MDELIAIFKECIIDDWGWALVAIAGNFAFALRFFVQWICSERKKKSYLPISFWVFSLIGSLILGIYAIHRREFMVLLSGLLATPIYVRNLILMRKENGDTKN